MSFSDDFPVKRIHFAHDNPQKSLQQADLLSVFFFLSASGCQFPKAILISAHITTAPAQSTSFSSENLSFPSTTRHVYILRNVPTQTGLEQGFHARLG